MPTSLAASTISTSQVGLTWANTNSIQTGVYVDISTDGTSFSPIATLGATATAYTDSGLTDGTKYYYEVQAFDATTTSGFSNTTSAVTELAAPTSLTATPASSSQINLAWTNNSSTEAGFDIDRSTDDASFSQIATVSSSTTTYSDTGLTANTKYYYEVQAFNTAAGVSAFSNVASATTSSGGTLNAPSGLTATEVNGSNRAQSIKLTWTDNDGGFLPPLTTSIDPPPPREDLPRSVR